MKHVTKIVFDLDGTLIDTREAVRQAYLAVGIVQPEEAWGRLPWQEWLPPLCDSPEHARFLHTKKNEHYEEMLARFAIPLPCWDIAASLKAPIITGASITAVHAVQTLFRRRLNVKANGVNRHGKAAWLSANGWGTYVDDCPDTRLYLQEVTTWKIQSPAEFLQSYSPPVPTLG